MSSSGIRLLASYPKSGNTWARAMLAAWTDRRVDINHLDQYPIICDRSLFDAVMGVESGYLTEAELHGARPDFHRLLAAECPEPRWFKCHDAQIPAPGMTRPPFPPGCLAGVVLITRDPRDVAPSLADHHGRGLDDTIALMADETYTQGLLPRSIQVPHRVSSWSRFQQSWLDSSFPLLLVRYEDLVADPARELGRILRFGNIDPDPRRLSRVIELTRFDTLRRQEEEAGFIEASPDARSRFFRQGRAGAWRETLGPEQVARIERDHGAMMARLGYLP